MLEFPTGGVPGRWGTDCYATLLTMLASHPREQAGHLHGLRRPRKQEQSLPAEHASSPTTTRHPTFTNRVECFVHPHNDRVDAAASDIELERREHVGAVCRRNLPRDSGDDAEAPLTSGYSTASSPECLEDSGGVMASLEAKIPTGPDAPIRIPGRSSSRHQPAREATRPGPSRRSRPATRSRPRARSGRHRPNR